VARQPVSAIGGRISHWIEVRIQKKSSWLAKIELLGYALTFFRAAQEF
jgi:hypothetical protein